MPEVAVDEHPVRSNWYTPAMKRTARGIGVDFATASLSELVGHRQVSAAASAAAQKELDFAQAAMPENIATERSSAAAFEAVRLGSDLTAIIVKAGLLKADRRNTDFAALTAVRAVRRGVDVLSREAVRQAHLTVAIEMRCIEASVLPKTADGIDVPDGAHLASGFRALLQTEVEIGQKISCQQVFTSGRDAAIVSRGLSLGQ